MMRNHQIRHLPVMSGGQVTGVLSDRDVKLALSINGVDPENTKVEEIASSEVFLVKPDSKLDEVARTMSEKKIGSVLVIDHHHLVGIFTTTDALKALDELLHTRLTH
jgi:acetoin utilization protein AcuB